MSGFCSRKRQRQPVDFALQPIAFVVGAHRPAEHHDAVVIGERSRQSLAEAGAADVEPGAEFVEEQADAPWRRMALMQDHENFLAPDALAHRCGSMAAGAVPCARARESIAVLASLAPFG